VHWIVDKPAIENCKSKEGIMMNKLNIAIIGCGWAGERHVRAFQQLPDRANISALVDNDEPFLNQKGSEWDISPLYTDYREVLSRDDVDAVSICLPHNIHAEVAIESARAGKHILCEKPMAVTLEEADAMIEAAEENGVKLMVAESARFQAINRRIKDLLDEGYIGKPILLRQIFMPGSPSKTGYVYPGRRAWISDKHIAGGGQWMVNGIHRVSVARWFFGEVESIYAVEYRPPEFELNIEANVCATMKFVNGPLGQIIFAPQTSHFGVFYDTIIHGDSGAIVVDKSDGKLHVYGEKVNAADNHLSMEVNQKKDTFVLEMEHFLDYVKKDAPCICDGVSERESLAIIVGGFKSMETGKEMKCYSRNKSS
jgi:predicted dehydrogenase